MPTTSDTGALELERVFKAPPERVFDAFVTPEALKGWFGPGTCRVKQAEVDLREGGDYHIRMETEFGEVDLVGAYRTVARPDRLAFSWRWENNPEIRPSDSVVEIDFEPHPDGTRMRFRQVGLPDEESRDNHGMGWNGSFDKLEVFFS